MRAASGLASELDVADADAQVSTTEATIPRLEEQQAQAISRLSFLLGEPPRTLAAELATPHPIPPVPPKVPVGLPSELARRRPDIRQAEAQLHAQTAEIGVAVANFYPAITLNGSFALQAVEFKNLGSWAARTYTIGPSISLPIFEGGRLVGNLRLTEAQQQEAAILYRRTVLAAWQEVDDALTAYAAEQHRRERLAQAVEQNRRALELSLAQYKQGLVAFLQVLTAGQQLLVTEQQTAESTTTVSTNLVSLCKALGGGWENAFPRQEENKAVSDAAAGQRAINDPYLQYALTLTLSRFEARAREHSAPLTLYRASKREGSGPRRSLGRVRVVGRSRLPAGHARQDEDLASPWNRLKPGVAIDLAVDRDGDAFLDQPLQPRLALAEAGKQLLDVGCLHLDDGLSAGRRLQRSGERHLDHQRPPAAASCFIAFSTRGGDMGSSVRRTPAAAETALAMAARGGTIEVSPTPRTP
jgi:hypothetical protein